MPRGIQTPDLQDRNLLLYSAELWAQKIKARIIARIFQILQEICEKIDFYALDSQEIYIFCKNLHIRFVVIYPFWSLRGKFQNCQSNPKSIDFQNIITMLNYSITDTKFSFLRLIFLFIWQIMILPKRLIFVAKNCSIKIVILFCFVSMIKF